MGVNERSLHVIDKEVIMENVTIFLLYGADLPVALALFFVSHYILHL